MANLRDRVKATTSTTGTGTITVGAATPGYRTFAAAYTENRLVSYVIEDGSDWETGVGLYTSSNNTLTRTLDASSTGALLSLSGSATVGIAFLSRDNPADWPFFEARSTGAAGTNGAFTTIAYGQVVADTHNAFSTANGIYTIPQDGTYDILVTFRISDGDITGKSYGVGAHTSNIDGTWFDWKVGNPNRQGAQYRRVSPFVKGDPLRSFYYMDAVSKGYTVADFVAMRIR